MDYEVKTKGDVKEMTHKDNTIKSLKQNVQKLRLEATQNKNSLKLSLNRAVDAECKNKILVQKLKLATKQSFTTENNIQKCETQLKSLTKENHKSKQFNLQFTTTNF